MDYATCAATVTYNLNCYLPFKPPFSPVGLLFEEGELYTAVASRLPEFGSLFEIHLLGVLEDEDAALAEHIALEYQINDLFAVGQVVGSIGEDDVELLGAAFQIEEHVGLHGVEVLYAEQLACLTDEVVVYGVDFHRGHTACTARSKLIADGTCSCKEVDHIALLEVHQIAQHVEEILFRKIGRGACPQILGRVDGSSLVYTTYYSHIVFLKRLPINLLKDLALLPLTCSSKFLRFHCPAARSMK